MSDAPDVAPTAPNAADALERWLRSDAAGEPPPEIDPASAAVARRLLAAADVAPDPVFIDDLASELAARHPTVSPPPFRPGSGPGGVGAGAMLAGIGFLLFTLFGLLIAWQEQQQGGAPAGSTATTQTGADRDRAPGTAAPTGDPRGRSIGTANVGPPGRATPSATVPARGGIAGATRTAGPLRATAPYADARVSGVGTSATATSAAPGSGAAAPTPTRPATERPAERNTPRPAASAGPVPSNTMPPPTPTPAVPTANTPGHTPEATAQATHPPGEPTREPSRTPREPSRTPGGATTTPREPTRTRGEATATPREPSRTPSPPSGTRERTPDGHTPDATRTAGPDRTPGVANADRPDRAPSRTRPPEPLGRRS